MRRIDQFCVICATALWAAAVAAQPATQASNNDERRRGEFHATFTEQDPRSLLEAQNRRHHIRIEEIQRYKLPEESFEAYVPQDYNGDTAVGILVWVNAGNRGVIPRGWTELMDKHRLVFISANNSGNERGLGVRFGLAMDAVHNLEKQYNVDPARVYIGGTSGGGKVASILPIIYPEIFAGAIPVVGVSFYRGIPLENDPKRVWAPDYERPPTVMYERARELSRFVFITGTNDMNHDAIKGTYDRGYLPDGFKYVDLFDVSGMGHTLPPAEWIDRAIDKLDEPLAALASKMFETGQQLERATKLPEARRLYQAVQLHGDQRLAARAQELLQRLQTPVQPTQAPPPLPATRPAAAPASRTVEAQQLLTLAENYERNKLYAQARERAERIVYDYSDTPAAAGAKQMLQRLPR